MWVCFYVSLVDTTEFKLYQAPYQSRCNTCIHCKYPNIHVYILLVPYYSHEDPYFLFHLWDKLMHTVSIVSGDHNFYVDTIHVEQDYPGISGTGEWLSHPLK